MCIGTGISIHSRPPTLLPVVLDPQIQNPLPTRTRGRPREGATGTRHHLSQFEIVTRKQATTKREERIQALSEPGERAESVFPLFFLCSTKKFMLYTKNLWRISLILREKSFPEWP